MRSRNIFESFRFAFSGLWYALRTQRNTRIHLTITAAVVVLGMIVGAGFAHNFGLASSPKGVGPHGIAAVVIGLLVCLFIGFTMRKKA